MQCISVETHLYSPVNNLNCRSRIQTTKKPNCQVNKMECSSTTITISPCNRWPIHTITGSQPRNTTRCIMGSRITSNRAYLPIRDIRATMFLGGRTYQTKQFTLFVQTTWIQNIMLLLNPKSRIPHLPPLPRQNPQTLEGFRQEASKAELAARVTAKPEVSDTQAVTNYTMLTAIQDLTRNVQALRMLMVTMVMLHFGLFMDIDK